MKYKAIAVKIGVALVLALVWTGWKLSYWLGKVFFWSEPKLNALTVAWSVKWTALRTVTPKV